MIESRTSTPNKLLEFLPKLSNYLIGMTILCYGAGFAITNLYLGQMGIVTFDLLRARYILAGLIFIFFLGAIAYLVVGLFRTLRKHYNKPRISVIMKALWFSLLNIGLLFIVIPAVGLFAGITDTPSYFISHPTQSDIPWSDWLSQAPLSILRFTSILFLIIIFSMTLVIIIFIIINPKDKNGIRTPRRQILAEAYGKFTESKGKDFVSLIGIYIIFYLFSLSGNLLSFYLLGKVDATSKTVFTFPYSWTQLFTAIVIIYIFIAIYLTFITLYPPSIIDDDTVHSKSYASIYMIAICILIIVPVYAIRVYPNLPQQIGGGQLLKVQVVISDKAIEPQFTDQSVDTYLIDRTDNSSFIELQNSAKSEYKIVEVQNGLIQSITYTHSP
jgi:hypothetical protein